MDNINQHIPPELLDKLMKLKNLKEGAESVGSHAEAENAAAKFQQLLLKHNLDEQAVLSAGVEKKAQMLHSELDLDPLQAKTEAEWVKKLATAVAHFSMCKVVVHTTYRHRYDQGKLSILGEKHNVATALFIIEQLISKIDIASKQAFKVYHGHEKRNTFRRGFLIGAVEAITVRLHKEEKEAIEQQKQEQTSSGVAATKNNNMGLMVIDKRALATRFMEDKFPNLQYTKNRQTNLSGRDGKEKGYEAGSKMDIHKGVSGKTNIKGNLNNS